MFLKELMLSKMKAKAVVKKGRGHAAEAAEVEEEEV